MRVYLAMRRKYRYSRKRSKISSWSLSSISAKTFVGDGSYFFTRSPTVRSSLRSPAQLLSEIVKFPPRATLTPWRRAHRGICRAPIARQINEFLSCILLSLTNTYLSTLHPPSHRATHITNIARDTCRDLTRRGDQPGPTSTSRTPNRGNFNRAIEKRSSRAIPRNFAKSRFSRLLWKSGEGKESTRSHSRVSTTTRVCVCAWRYRTAMSSGRDARRECRP